jgi:hypothetical protein
MSEFLQEQTDPTADPNCPKCNGSGWRNEGPRPCNCLNPKLTRSPTPPAPETPKSSSSEKPGERRNLGSIALLWDTLARSSIEFYSTQGSLEVRFSVPMSSTDVPIEMTLRNFFTQLRSGKYASPSEELTLKMYLLEALESFIVLSMLSNQSSSSEPETGPSGP